MKNNIKADLLKQREDYERLIQSSKGRLEAAPEGTLIISKSGNHTDYYQCVRKEDDNSFTRIYLKNDDISLACELAQKSFDEGVVRRASEQLRCIDKFLKQYDPDLLTNYYSSLSDARKLLLNQDIIDNETYAKIWQAMPYAPYDKFFDVSKEYYSERGERVRSKSELITANTLKSLSAPYRYEPPYKLKDGNILRPDFMALNKRTREDYIIEILGMMDDPDYCNDQIEKIQKYIRNGIFPGEKLIIIAETSARPLSTKDLTLVLKHYLL